MNDAVVVTTPTVDIDLTAVVADATAATAADAAKAAAAKAKADKQAADKAAAKAADEAKAAKATESVLKAVGEFAAKEAKAIGGTGTALAKVMAVIDKALADASASRVSKALKANGHKEFGPDTVAKYALMHRVLSLGGDQPEVSLAHPSVAHVVRNVVGKAIDAGVGRPQVESLLADGATTGGVVGTLLNLTEVAKADRKAAKAAEKAAAAAAAAVESDEDEGDDEAQEATIADLLRAALPLLLKAQALAATVGVTELEVDLAAAAKDAAESVWVADSAEFVANAAAA